MGTSLVDELTWDHYIYPRKNKSNKTIESYTEALGIGADFPPIKVQQVNNYPDGNGGTKQATLILDGVHRWHAHKRAGHELVPIAYWADEVLDYEEYKIQLRLESSKRNTEHGDRLTEADKKETAELVANDDPQQNWTEQDIAGYLGVPRRTISDWISPIRQRQKASRDSQILRLSRLGWKGVEIANKAGVSEGRVSQIFNNGNSAKIKEFLAEGRKMSWIADAENMDLALAWALRMDDLSDRERFQELGWGLRTWDDWRFNSCDGRFGDKWPGQIPAQLVAHTLYFFTRPDDLVLDPMAGGGVVPDTCLAFGRRCSAFDLNTRPERPEILYHYWDPDDLQWPDVKSPDLIFFDPPYYIKKEADYQSMAKGDEVPISSLLREDYLRFFESFFQLAHTHTKRNTRLAFLNADWRDYGSTPALDEKHYNAVTLFDYRDLLVATDWEITHRIECPMSSERLSGAQVKTMQDKRILGTVGRTLLIAKKRSLI